MNVILFALWFFLPAGLANSAPVFASRLPLLRNLTFPLDFGASFREKRVFGVNKTWRGLMSGIVIATFTLWVQQYLYVHTGWAKTISGSIDYSSLPILLLGPLFGLGALLGDAVESFFKRQRGVPSGESWFPFDQFDYVIGGLLASSLVVQLTLQEYVAICAVWFCLHILSVYIGFLIGLRDSKI
jgi:CDP-2,3-bis-(O-geranylgeranyl)-sn-glycerol synthase